MSKYWPKIVFICALPLLFFLGYYAARERPPRNSTLTIEIAPKDARATIDGKGAKIGDNKVVVGNHVVVVKKDGFKTQSQAADTKVGQTIYVGITLQPSSPETKNWYEKNSDDRQLLESISSRLFDYQTQTSTQDNTFLQKLPVSFGNGRGGLIRINSGVPVKGSNEPAIYITAHTPGDKQTALTWMRSRGYSPATMDIVFVKPSNSTPSVDYIEGGGE